MQISLYPCTLLPELKNCVLFTLTSIALYLPGTISANELGVNLYGVSYHFLKPNQSREYLNEFNPGLGIRANFGGRNTSQLFFEGGSYKDTFDNQARYLSIGFLLRVIQQFRVGLNAAAYTSESVRNGDVVFAPVPIVAYSLGPVTGNVVYLPKYGGINAYNTLGAYVTIRIFEGAPAKKE
jgi:hypothetical protein